MVECWGDVPFKTTSTEDAYNLSIPRTDKQTIYDFIIKEMYGSAEALKSDHALTYLPGRVSKSAAWGMLARVYMFRAGEPKRDKEVGLANNTTSAEITEYFKKASYYAQLVKNEGHSLTAKYWDFFIDICSDKYNTCLLYTSSSFIITLKLGKEHFTEEQIAKDDTETIQQTETIVPSVEIIPDSEWKEDCLLYTSYPVINFVCESGTKDA